MTVGITGLSGWILHRKALVCQIYNRLKNGLLVGYHFGRGDVRAIEGVDGLGHDAGYLFQVLNDLEPFYGSAQNDAYKGRENSDFTRLKKNFVVAKYFEGQSAAARNALIAKISAQPESARSLIQSV